MSVLAGGVIVAASVYVLIDPTARFVEAAVKLAGNAETTTSELQDLLPRFFGANDVSVAFEIGLWLTLAGGALVALAGMLGIAVTRRMAPLGRPPLLQGHAASEGPCTDRTSHPHQRTKVVSSRRWEGRQREVCRSDRSMKSNDPPTTSRISLLHLLTPTRRRIPPPRGWTNRRPAAQGRPRGQLGRLVPFSAVLRLKLGDKLVDASLELFPPPRLAFLGQGRDRVVVVVPGGERLRVVALDARSGSSSSMRRSPTARTWTCTVTNDDIAPPVDREEGVP